MADRNYWRSATERKSPHGSTIKDDHRNDRIRDHFKPGALPSDAPVGGPFAMSQIVGRCDIDCQFGRPWTFS
jgi:hypothetical protein